MSYSMPTVHVYLRNFVSIGLFCCPVAAKNPNFCRFLPFFGLRHFVMSPIGINLRKLSTIACTTTNLPLSNGIKIVSVLQRLHGEIGHTICDIQKRDEQANRQTKKLNVFGHPGGRCNPRPTKLGTVIEDLKHVLAPLKPLGVRYIVSP